MTVDPVQLEIIRNALLAVAEEMSVTIHRTSRSTVVREMFDYSTAIFDGKGRAVAQSARIPVHLNSMGVCLDAVIADHIPLEDWNEGDVILTNDPYSGGQHLPDFLVFRPIFSDGRRIGIAAALVHHIDIGGGAPGSYYAQATEVFQEGLRLPPCKVVEGGRPNGAVISIIHASSREPEQVAGDFASQLAATEVGAAAYRKLVTRYGAEVLEATIDAILDQSEAAMRAVIRDIPDGSYEFEDFVDDDGITEDHLKVHAEVTVTGETCRVDLSGSCPQAAGPVNCTLNMTRSAVYCALIMMGEGAIMANAGAYRPIEIAARSGTLVNCRAPAPVANRMATGHRVVTTVLGAFAAARPDMVPAAYYGVSYVSALSVPDKATGGRSIYFEIEVGGWGAHPDEDGASGFSAGFHNLANSPIEMNEAFFPITFTEYALIADSGGAGRTRGGLGLRREWRLDAAEGTISASFDRFRVPPYGLRGGAPGRAGRFYLKRAGETRQLAAKTANLALRRGDRVGLETSGGGGNDDPKKRARTAVELDIEGGYITDKTAQKTYAYKS